MRWTQLSLRLASSELDAGAIETAFGVAADRTVVIGDSIAHRQG